MAPDLHSFLGGCGCRAVSISVCASPEAALCHCETCRRCSGGIGMGWIKSDRPVGCLGPCRPSGVRLRVRTSTDSCGSRAAGQLETVKLVAEIPASGRLHGRVEVAAEASNTPPRVSSRQIRKYASGLDTEPGL